MRRFLCLLMASRASSRRPAALLLRRLTAPRRAPRRATRLGAAAPDVARVAARDFAPADAAALVAPVVLTGVLDDGACEAWCDALLTQAGDLEVLSQLQPREGAPTSPSPPQVSTLAEFVDAIAPSDDVDDDAGGGARMLFDEALLDRAAVARADGAGSADGPAAVLDLGSEVAAARARAFGAEQSWLELLPRGARPADAVIVAGAGARSTLHRDPFDWTGTSLCVAGRKVWRFVAPPRENYERADDGFADRLEEALEAYYLPSAAWSDDDDEAPTEATSAVGFSEGVQCDLSLYESGRSGGAALERARDRARRAAHGESSGADDDAAHAADARSLSLDRTAADAIGAADRDARVITTVCNAGEMVLIPARWWHQTYALEPSVAVASQHVGRHNAGDMIAHSLDVAARAAAAQYWAGREEGVVGDVKPAPTPPAPLVDEAARDEMEPRAVVALLTAHLAGLAEWREGWCRKGH